MSRVTPVIFLVAVLSDLAAQETSPISPGTRVRVEVLSDTSTRDLSPFYRQSQWIIGSLVSLDADSLVIKSTGRDIPTTISYSHIGEFAVSHGRSSRAVSVLMGASLGFLIHDTALRIYSRSDDFRAWFIPAGVLLGATSSMVVSSLDRLGAVRRAGIGAVTGALPGLLAGSLSDGESGYTVMVGILDGAFVGALAGAVAIRWEGWKSVRLPAHVSLFPHGGGYVALWFEFGK